jgi:hypothetical protein
VLIDSNRRAETDFITILEPPTIVPPYELA